MTLKKKKMQELIKEIVGESFFIGDIMPDDLKFGRELCRKDVEALKVVQDNSLELEKLIENLDENILPRPVIRDDNGKIIKDYSPCDFYLKLQEEIFEVMEVQADFDRDWNSRTYDDIAEEIVDVITVCISQLEALGFDEEKRSEIFRKVNEKNEKRGYFKETDSNGD